MGESREERRGNRTRTDSTPLPVQELHWPGSERISMKGKYLSLSPYYRRGTPHFIPYTAYIAHCTILYIDQSLAIIPSPQLDSMPTDPSALLNVSPGEDIEMPQWNKSRENVPEPESYRAPRAVSSDPSGISIPDLSELATCPSFHLVVVIDPI